MPRYAIYYAPHAGSLLARFGASVLGYDASTGADVEPPDHPLFRDPASLGWTAEPRRYGFHATLKAPFRLVEGRTAAELETALQSFAASRRPFDLTMTLSLVGRFLALVLAEPSPAMDELATACVRRFDLFREPLTPEDRERRHPDQLTAQQVANLDEWGYPFVLEDFQFHMTLSGALESRDRAKLEPVLRDIAAEVPLTTTVDSLALFRQEGPNDRFILQRRFDFAAVTAS
jgi:putative phosphonate metabolism protein